MNDNVEKYLTIYLFLDLLSKVYSPRAMSLITTHIKVGLEWLAKAQIEEEGHGGTAIEQTNSVMNPKGWWNRITSTRTGQIAAQTIPHSAAIVGSEIGGLAAAGTLGAVGGAGWAIIALSSIFTSCFLPTLVEKFAFAARTDQGNFKKITLDQYKADDGGTMIRMAIYFAKMKKDVLSPNSILRYGEVALENSAIVSFLLLLYALSLKLDKMPTTTDVPQGPLKNRVYPAGNLEGIGLSANPKLGELQSYFRKLDHPKLDMAIRQQKMFKRLPFNLLTDEQKKRFEEMKVNCVMPIRHMVCPDTMNLPRSDLSMALQGVNRVRADLEAQANDVPDDSNTSTQLAPLQEKDKILGQAVGTLKEVKLHGYEGTGSGAAGKDDITGRQDITGVDGDDMLDRIVDIKFSHLALLPEQSQALAQDQNQPEPEPQPLQQRTRGRTNTSTGNNSMYGYATRMPYPVLGDSPEIEMQERKTSDLNTPLMNTMLSPGLSPMHGESDSRPVSPSGYSFSVSPDRDGAYKISGSE